MDEREPLTIDLGNAKIVLEMRCPTCKGAGHRYVDDGKTIVRCDKCGGNGIVLSNQGYAILMLIKKYGHLYLK